MTTEEANKPFNITAVCRADLLGEGYTEDQVCKLDDADMEWIARKLADAYMNVFWIDLRIIVDQALKDKKIKRS